MVHLGTKLVNCVLESLCSGPSKIQLKNAPSICCFMGPRLLIKIVKKYI